jgi:hypothetical protein
MAEKENKELASCVRKRAYVDERSAKITGQKAYKCPICKLWHRAGPYVQLKNAVLPENFKLDAATRSAKISVDVTKKAQ